MAGFKSIVGHQDVIRHLQNAISADKVSHAYIFSGEKGAGKKLMAHTFAMTLQCEAKGTEPCMKCTSCKKAMSGNHPDIIYIQHEKPGSIGVDEIRSQLASDAQIKPYESPYKIYIVNDAQLMTIQAQNALLKTIEEPPAYVILMLLTDNMDQMLQTIISRCVTLSFKAVGDDLVKKYLMDEMQVPDYQAEIDASIAQGNIGKAKKLASSEDFTDVTKNAIRILKRSGTVDLYEMVENIKELTADKQNIYDYLDIFLSWFRDVLLFKATKEVDSLVFKQEINSIRERASKSSYEGIEAIIEAIEKAKIRLHANVNMDLALELLFVTIREN